ncbi:hypothetical protein BASA61_007904 [Batrachochytrium salamandrivorans]|nr:hypothetical protein BASA61_007904 [Batrachochytrium salamandrivorans]
MGRPSKRVRQLQQAQESKRHHRLPQVEHNEDNSDSTSAVDFDEDYYLSSDIDDEQVEEGVKSFLRWNKQGDSRKFRTVYTGASRTTFWRKKREKKELERSVQGVPKITSFFPVASASAEGHPERNMDLDLVESEENQNEPMSIADALVELSKFTSIRRNALQDAQMSSISKFDLLRYMAVEKFLVLQQPPHNFLKMAASRMVAEALYSKSGQDSMSRRIRRWAKYFLLEKKLDDHQQGKHVKILSLIEEDNIQSSCRTWLRSQRNDMISALSFSKFITENIHVQLSLPWPIQISERTASKWMHRLNFDYKQYGKGLYKDGHERDDVVAYRTSFLDRMNRRLPFMATYTGDDMMTVILPNLAAGSKQIVVITHDESCFSSHDGKRTIWMDQERKPLRPKGDGRSMMVSEFLCECHGPMRLSVAQQLAHPSVLSETLCVIKPGKNADGYWTNKDLAEQLEFRAIPIFKILHPNCIGLFLFDNSMNHHAFAPDALKSVGLPLKDGGKNMKKMRNGWFEIDGVRHIQPMQYLDGLSKGLDTILKERGMWHPSMKVKDARELLQSQPDFQAQKPWLQEIVETNQDLTIDYYPKYHCEFNFIELYWGAAKRYSRRNCDYSFKGLELVLPAALNSVSLTLIRKYARKCFRYMDAYRARNDIGNGLTMEQVEYAMKKYAGHRRIPQSIMHEFDK